MSDSTQPPPPGASSAAQDAQGDSAVLPFTRVYDSQLSAFAEPVEMVVRSADEWQRAWLGAHPNRAVATPAAPPVDFRAELVVLVSTGTQPSGGVSIRVDTVRARANGGADVLYTVSRPGAGCMSTQQITAPVDAVRLARRTGEVRFIRHDRTTPC